MYKKLYVTHKNIRVHYVINKYCRYDTPSIYICIVSQLIQTSTPNYDLSHGGLNYKNGYYVTTRIVWLPEECSNRFSKHVQLRFPLSLFFTNFLLNIF